MTGYGLHAETCGHVQILQQTCFCAFRVAKIRKDLRFNEIFVL